MSNNPSILPFIGPLFVRVFADLLVILYALQSRYRLNMSSLRK